MVRLPRPRCRRLLGRRYHRLHHRTCRRFHRCRYRHLRRRFRGSRCRHLRRRIHHLQHCSYIFRKGFEF
ncbi:hypothetical protein PBCV1_a353R [Paramecium bursaria Chlorella virus 1]|uniref:Uncharacterized protein n=1 Tax=Paramecium bursaria Chlorella virus 1 TaxID=10506 RepID=Q84667_PBCV1|nr:hypothetical protein PBCV1_a353R [Paramecium bursaria Chlorella virus 1]AAC96721.1 hypothetical protein [Paramecium bursaria Chlorella virus 1]